MKIAPVFHCLAPRADVKLVHTGQHYDKRMSGSFFDELGLPEPAENLEVGSGTHAEQTADAMVRFERYLLENKTDAVVVVGDVNSTLACALAAAKLHVPVAHVEAGLRSNDWCMPEEVNRVATDHLSHWLFATTEEASTQLLREGIPASRVHVTGNVMIDTLLRHEAAGRQRLRHRQNSGEVPEEYVLLTLHRPSNVDSTETLSPLLEAISDGADGLPVVWPLHPRTEAMLRRSGAVTPVSIQRHPACAYLDFVALMAGASIVVTDSGGVQEETSVLGVPCVTVRNNTERPITCTHGTNVLAGTSTSSVREAVRASFARPRARATIPLWDGRTAERIAAVLLHDLERGWVPEDDTASSTGTRNGQFR